MGMYSTPIQDVIDRITFHCGPSVTLGPELSPGGLWSTGPFDEIFSIVGYRYKFTLGARENLISNGSFSAASGAGVIFTATSDSTKVWRTAAALGQARTYSVKQFVPRILEGLKFETFPRTQVEGLADLPGIRLLIPMVEGRLHPGGRSQQEDGTLTIHLIIGVKRDVPNALASLMAQVESVMDALNYDPTGVFIPAIKGTIKPFGWKIENTYPVDSSLNAQVSISLEPRPTTLGQRRN